MEINSNRSKFNKFIVQLKQAEIDQLEDLITRNDYLVKLNMELVTEFFICTMEDLKSSSVKHETINLYNAYDFDLAITTYIFPYRKNINRSDAYTVLAFIKDFYDNIFNENLSLWIQEHVIVASTEKVKNV